MVTIHNPPTPKAIPQSKSALLVDDQENRVNTEVMQLLSDIRRINPEGASWCKFGELFADPAVEQFYEALVGTMKAAKRKGFITFKGQVLFKGMHDDVVVRIVDDEVDDNHDGHGSVGGNNSVNDNSSVSGNNSVSGNGNLAPQQKSKLVSSHESTTVTKSTKQRGTTDDSTATTISTSTTTSTARNDTDDSTQCTEDELSKMEERTQTETKPLARTGPEGTATGVGGGLGRAPGGSHSLRLRPAGALTTKSMSLSSVAFQANPPSKPKATVDWKSKLKEQRRKSYGGDGSSFHRPLNKSRKGALFVPSASQPRLMSSSSSSATGSVLFEKGRASSDTKRKEEMKEKSSTGTAGTVAVVESNKHGMLASSKGAKHKKDRHSVDGVGDSGRSHKKKLVIEGRDRFPSIDVIQEHDVSVDSKGVCDGEEDSRLVRAYDDTISLTMSCATAPVDLVHRSSKSSSISNRHTTATTTRTAAPSETKKDINAHVNHTASAGIAFHANAIAETHAERVDREINQLLLDVRRILPTGEPYCSFGDLFDDPEVEQYYEALVGTLKSAKRRGVITFKGQMLLKGMHDKVRIELVQ